jgi:peptidoglycan/xylan/chitin deacetylase (PgdA/CDA1 family)
MKSKLIMIPLLIFFVLNTISATNVRAETDLNKTKSYIQKKYAGQQPKLWGEKIPGVILRLPTNKKVIALTFDACGGSKGSGYDAELINYLRLQHIPATLFINARWIDANHNRFMALSKMPQFEIENHGYLHKPLSVNGKSAWGIKGTSSPAEVVDEVYMNKLKIAKLTGRTPKFFRPWTAYFDDVAVKIVYEVGQKPLNYDILGDAGATFNRQQVKNALLSSKPGSIVIMHMNQPKGETFEGLKDAIPILQKRGYKFVKLDDYIK